MSLWIVFCGGVLLFMMGQRTPSEALFYYFRIEDHIPQGSFTAACRSAHRLYFVRETLKASYSHTGRPSIDPEALLRILLIGYLYGITSERRLVEDVWMHLAYRWFTSLGFDQDFLITPLFRRTDTVATAGPVHNQSKAPEAAMARIGHRSRRVKNARRGNQGPLSTRCSRVFQQHRSFMHGAGQEHRCCLA